MKIVINTTFSAKYSADLVVFCIDQKKKNTPNIPQEVSQDVLSDACSLGDFKGDEKDSLVVYGGSEKSSQYKRVAYVGVGRIPKNIKSHILEEKMRGAGGVIASLAKKYRAAKICLYLPSSLTKQQTHVGVYGLTQGAILGDYTFQKYKTTKEKPEEHKGISEIKFICTTNVASLRKESSLARSSAIAACHARDMANEPGNNWTADSFADFARDLAQKHHLKCSVFAEKELKKMGMGGILAVNQGSERPAKLVVLEHHFDTKAKTVVLVGKGLTFDSGGISLKPAAGMEDMKYDMCGGAAVLGAMSSVAVEKPQCNVVAIVPATDNMTGGAALKPGDIIYHYNKTSSEIINTDAEGRLILADALAYGVENYSPDYIIDVATLTGAVIIGLGHHHSGLFTNNDALAGRLKAAGEKSGEPVWRLPLGEEYKKQLKSKVADVKNTGGRPAGAISAAEYLHGFVGSTPWAHLDIAGTAWNFTEKSYIPEGGPSGMAVRTLLEFIRQIEN
jgi:leucyl aminopeptidase